MKPPKLKARIFPPTVGNWERPVHVRYILHSDPARFVHIEFSYSLDNGATFQTGSEAADAGSSGRTNLAASPAGMLHLFVWDAQTDLGPLPPPNLELRVQPFIALEGAADTCSVSTLPPGPHPPAVAHELPRHGRKQMSDEERQAVSERMRRYWAGRQKPPRQA